MKNIYLKTRVNPFKTINVPHMTFFFWHKELQQVLLWKTAEKEKKNNNQISPTIVDGLKAKWNLIFTYNTTAPYRRHTVGQPDLCLNTENDADTNT